MMEFSFPRRIQREKRRAGANLHDAPQIQQGIENSPLAALTMTVLYLIHRREESSVGAIPPAGRWGAGNAPTLSAFLLLLLV